MASGFTKKCKFPIKYYTGNWNRNNVCDVIYKNNLHFFL